MGEHQRRADGVHGEGAGHGPGVDGVERLLGRGALGREDARRHDHRVERTVERAHDAGDRRGVGHVETIPAPRQPGDGGAARGEFRGEGGAEAARGADDESGADHGRAAKAVTACVNPLSCGNA